MEEGMKNDFIDGKLRWDLLPIEIIEQVVGVLTFGSQKYADNNWQKVPQARERYYAAAMRHLVDWRRGNKVDDGKGGSGYPHLAASIANLIFLMWFDENTKEHDKGN